MKGKNIMKHLIVIYLTSQISFQSCSGTSSTLEVQNQNYNLNTKLRNTRANFRVLEEPRHESLVFSNQNHRYNGPDIIEPSVQTDSSSAFGNYNLKDQFPNLNNKDKLLMEGSEARFSLQNRHTGKRPRPNGNAGNGPSRRQGVTEAPKLDITSVSPIQSSLGGLTGLQGLPPLSLIQFVKLLVAVTPFIIPLVFVPLLIFTIGMFMIPVNKTSYFIGGDAGVRNAGSTISSPWTSWGSSVVPALKNLAKHVANHEECIERLTCELGRKYLPAESNGKSSIVNRNVVQRILNYFDHPLMHRISRSLQTSPDACNSRICRPASFLEKHFLRTQINDAD